MKNPLRKRLLRELRGNLGKYIAIFLLLTATITVGSGFFVVSDSMEYTLDNSEKSGKLEDGSFTTNIALSNSNLQKLEAMQVQIEKKYYIDVKDFDKDATLRVYEDRKALNLSSLHKGRLPDKEDEIALDRLFAHHREIEVGDVVELEGRKMTVSGLISLPDYNSLYRSNSDFVMNAINFGVAVVSKEGFTNLNQDKTIYSYAYYFKDRVLETKAKEKIEGQIAKSLAQYTQIQEFLPTSDNQAISFLRNDMGSDVPTMKTLIYILIVIMAFVFAIIIRSTIESEAAIIGTLRASGYTKQELVCHYMALPLITTGFSAIIGNVLGYTVMIAPFKTIFYSTYCLAPFMIRWNTEAFLLTTIVPILIMIIINYFVIYYMLSLSPLKFLRRDLKRGKQKKAIKIPNFKFITRFHLRVILQNKGSYLLLFIGMFFASVLLLFGLGIMPVINNYVEKADVSCVSEYQYLLKSPVPSVEGEPITVVNLDTWYEYGNCDIEIVVNGIKDDSKFYKELPLYDVEKGIVLSSDFANKTGYKKGDVIRFKNPYVDQTYDLKVAEIYPYQGTLSVFMKQKDLNQMLNQEVGYFNGYLSNQKLNLDERYVAKLISRDDIKGAAEQMAYSFNGIVTIIDVFSILIYLVLIYILTKLVIEKNVVNISLMKVFGYRLNEVRKLYFKATTIVVLTSLIVCVPLEYIVVKYIMKYSLDKMGGYIEFYIPWYIYLQIIAAGIISYFVINGIHRKRVTKIPMNLALKSRE